MEHYKTILKSNMIDMEAKPAQSDDSIPRATELTITKDDQVSTLKHSIYRIS